MATYRTCPRCGERVRADKPIVGSLHRCRRPIDPHEPSVWGQPDREWRFLPPE
jgi:hypothetical protein